MSYETDVRAKNNEKEIARLKEALAELESRLAKAPGPVHKPAVTPPAGNGNELILRITEVMEKSARKISEHEQKLKAVEGVLQKMALKIKELSDFADRTDHVVARMEAMDAEVKDQIKKLKNARQKKTGVKKRKTKLRELAIP